MTKRNQPGIQCLLGCCPRSTLRPATSVLQTTSFQNLRTSSNGATGSRPLKRFARFWPWVFGACLVNGLFLGFKPPVREANSRGCRIQLLGRAVWQGLTTSPRSRSTLHCDTWASLHSQPVSDRSRGAERPTDLGNGVMSGGALDAGATKMPGRTLRLGPICRAMNASPATCPSTKRRGV
jgi:hypothetical protein